MAQNGEDDFEGEWELPNGVKVQTGRIYECVYNGKPRVGILKAMRPVKGGTGLVFFVGELSHESDDPKDWKTFNENGIRDIRELV